MAALKWLPSGETCLRIDEAIGYAVGVEQQLLAKGTVVQLREFDGGVVERGGGQKVRIRSKIVIGGSTGAAPAGKEGDPGKGGGREGKGGTGRGRQEGEEEVGRGKGKGLPSREQDGTGRGGLHNRKAGEKHTQASEHKSGLSRPHDGAAMLLPCHSARAMSAESHGWSCRTWRASPACCQLALSPKAGS